jgi:hypothetical protein
MTSGVDVSENEKTAFQKFWRWRNGEMEETFPPFPTVSKSRDVLRGGTY